MNTKITEQWKSIPNYAGLYEASNLGNIRRIAKGSHTSIGKVLKPAIIRGYARINLRNKGVMHQFSVARLVYSAFNPDKDITNRDIHHKNNNPLDNRIENLKLLTKEEHQRLGKSQYSFKRTQTETVRTIRRAYQTGEFTIMRLADIYNINFDTVSKIVNYKTHKSVI